MFSLKKKYGICFFLLLDKLDFCFKTFFCTIEKKSLIEIIKF